MESHLLNERNERRRTRLSGGLLLAAAVWLLASGTGCIVSQPRGDGKLAHLTEPSSNRDYWLYLPEAYLKAAPDERNSRRWPMVVTFHGMKPFDHAGWQALEWEAEADRYGFIVVAPRLNSADVLHEFPMTKVSNAVRGDEEASLAVMNHVFATTQADRSNVLATGFSSGGYMAHYMFNRHPERFTALAVRQANFSSSVLEPSLTAKSKNKPVHIVYTENDVGICQTESQEAVQWYEKFGYENVGWVKLKGLGHVRTPEIAADFFGRCAGVTPSRSPAMLANRQALAGNSKGMAFLGATAVSSERYASRPTTQDTPPRPRATPTPPPASVPPPVASKPPAASPNGEMTPAAPRLASAAPEPTVDVRSAPQTRNSVYDAGPTATMSAAPGGTSGPPAGPRVASATPARYSPPPPPPVIRTPPPEPAPPSQQTPPRGFQYEYEETSDGVSIRVSSAIGIEPLHLGFWADCPRDWHRTADFIWTLNGRPIGNGINGQTTIVDEGDYMLALTVRTLDGKMHRTSRRVRVLPPAPASYYTQGRRP